TLTEGEVPLLTETADMVVVPSDQTVRLVDHTIIYEIKEHSGKNKRKVGFNIVPPPMKKARTGGIAITEPVATSARKSPAIIQKLIAQSSQADVGSGSAASRAKEFVSSSFTPTPDRGDHEDSGSTHDGNVRTRRASERYVVLSSSFEQEDANTIVSPKYSSPNLHVQIRVENVTAEPVDRAVGASILGNEAGTSSIPRDEIKGSSSMPNNGSPVDDFYESQTIDSSKDQDIYVPKWDVTNDARMDDPVMCKNLIGHVPPPGYWAFLRNRSDADFPT
ncbi:hypothetical protein Tco_1048266, partial [Tanacetum coccineum]